MFLKGFQVEGKTRKEEREETGTVVRKRLGHNKMEERRD